MAIIENNNNSKSVLPETVIFLIVNEGHERFWGYIQEELLQINDNIRGIIINKKYPLGDGSQIVSININGIEHNFMLRFLGTGSVFGLENHDDHELCCSDRDYNYFTIRDREQTENKGISPGEVLKLLKTYNDIYSERWFYPDEFVNSSLTVAALTNAIRSDLQSAPGHDLINRELNEILTIPDLFDKYQEVRPEIIHSKYLLSLLEGTEEIRKKKFMDLDEHSQFGIERIIGF